MRAFFDTNILVYAFAKDVRSVWARDLLETGGIVSIQSLNEFTLVCRRELKISWVEIGDAIDKILALCEPPVVLDLALHRTGRSLAERYSLSVYDGMIVAAALAGKCDILWSEDMHDGLVVDGRLRIINPFAPVQ